VIASSAFFVLDGILGWSVELYDGSWSQWGQLSADAANGGQLRADSPWRTDIPSRSGLVAFNYSSINPPSSPPSYSGTGLDDLTTALVTTISVTIDRYYRIEIDGTGTPDTFRWSKDNGATWDASGVSITGAAQELTENVAVTFGATTGHTTSDRWIFTAGPRKAVEILSADGATCTATLNLDGTKTFTPSGCTPAAPGSFDPSGNKIEEEDAQFMNSGGGGGGGGGEPPTGC
jgi:hypothetical protein